MTQDDPENGGNPRSLTHGASRGSLSSIEMVFPSCARTDGILARCRLAFVFRRVAGYRLILEAHRMTEPPLPRGVGWTVPLPNSPWLAGVRTNDPLLAVPAPGSRHDVIVTEGDVIDSRCSASPEIVEGESAKVDEHPPGKAPVLYHPEDKDQIERSVKHSTKRKPDVSQSNERNGVSSSGDVSRCPISGCAIWPVAGSHVRRQRYARHGGGVAPRSSSSVLTGAPASRSVSGNALLARPPWHPDLPFTSPIL